MATCRLAKFFASHIFFCGSLVYAAEKFSSKGRVPKKKAIFNGICHKGGGGLACHYGFFKCFFKNHLESFPYCQTTTNNKGQITTNNNKWKRTTSENKQQMTNNQHWQTKKNHKQQQTANINKHNRSEQKKQKSEFK